MNIYSATPHQAGNGAQMYNPIPGAGIKQISPFVLLDHFVANAAVNFIFQFPPHPHKGFAAVSVLLSGAILHQDSLGSIGSLGSGDVQWMEAGSGVVHSEAITNPFPHNAKIENLQIWINEPAVAKKNKAFYQEAKANEIPKIELKNGLARLIAGSYHKEQSKLVTQTPLFILDFIVEPNFEHELILPKGFQAGIYVTEGEIKVKSKVLSQFELAHIEPNTTKIELIAKENARFIVLAGEPIFEPMVQYGPFVMNNMQEISKAFQEYENGEFGDI